jgi:two-component system, OmpR family, alkaline phosphatase synthesis response regulator PhoP
MNTARVRILLVEDEKHLAQGLLYNLSAEGYEAVLARDGAEALQLFGQGPWNLIVLDLMLPLVDGFEVARQIRSKDPRVPVLMLTARAADEDRIRGLECGADDYLTKPFHLQELLLRIQGILRRSSWYRTLPGEGDRYRFGEGCWVDFRERTAKGPRGEMRLTEKELLVLKCLVERPSRTVPRVEMLTEIWGYAPGVETRTLDNFIRRLRTYFEKDPASPRHIVSVRGMGYRFDP